MRRTADKVDYVVLYTQSTYSVLEGRYQSTSFLVVYLLIKIDSKHETLFPDFT